MFTFLRLILSGSALAGNLQAKFQAAKAAAAVIVAFAIGAVVLVLASVLAAAASAYLVLEPIVGDYQAALLICAFFLLSAAICVLSILSKIKRITNPSGAALQSHPAAQPMGTNSHSRTSSGALLETLSSPAVISALTIGVLLGRRMMSKKDD